MRGGGRRQGVMLTVLTCAGSAAVCHSPGTAGDRRGPGSLEAAGVTVRKALI